MMNVLTDILCDTSPITAPQIISHSTTNSQTSSIMAPQSYNVPSSKIIRHDLALEPKPVHILESVSQLSSFDQPLNHSSRSEINLYDSTSQIHIPSNLDAGFEEQSNVSVFSDSFPEIVPSWLTHDFMKASDNLPSPSILSDVPDIYSANNEPNHLEMLDLNFPPELTNHQVSDNLGPSCDVNNQKILEELPMHRFPNSGSMIMPSFTMNSPQFHVSVNKTNLQQHSFKHPETNLDHSQSLMNSMLPCNNDMMHLPLPSTITEQCLSSSSPMISNSQSQSHVVCDKLPQISLNHLDTLLGNDSALSDIQLLRHNFTDVHLTGDNNNPPVDAYNPNGNFFNNMMPPDLPRFPHLKDVSVQVSSDFSALYNAVNNPNCFACNHVELEVPMDVVQCFKCKHCDFVSLHKCSIARHMKASHSKTVRFNNNDSLMNVSQRSIDSNSFITASSIENQVDCQNNFLKDLGTKQENFSERDKLNNLGRSSQEFASISALNNQIMIPKEPDRIKEPMKVTNLSSRQIQPKASDGKEAMKKNMQKKTANDKSSEKSEKSLSSHKKAWQKKMTRELGTYICESKGCNVRFRAIDNLEYHRKCHGDGVRTFICPECGANFFNWGAIAGHLWRTHGNDMELQKCDQCPFRTFSLSRLENIHKRIHGDECLFLCDTCGKSFKNGKQLRNHRVKHNKSQTNKCNLCNTSFSDRDTLKRHIHNHHLKIKPFQCKYCDHAASTKDTLDLHMRSHTGDRPYKCDECDYSSTDRNTLRRHKMKHSGYKPYKCPLCAYSCNQASRFKDHLEKIHQDQMTGLVFSCNLCPYKTIKEALYAKHMREHGNRSQEENSAPAIPSCDNLFLSAEELNTSLSPSDNMSSNFNKHKNIQSFRLISLEIDLLKSSGRQHLWKLS